MAFTSFISLRYLRTSRNNRYFSWITMLTIAGIAIGVAVLIVVLSVIGGFETELRNRFLAANAHIMAYRFPAGLKDHQKWQTAFQEDFGTHLTGISPFVQFETMGRKDYLIHSMLIKGIAPKSRQAVQNVGDIIRPTSALSIIQKEIDDLKEGRPLPERPSIILGKVLAEKMNVSNGDVVDLIAPRADQHGEQAQEMRQFKVVGIYDSGLQHYDKQLGILSLPAAQSLFHMEQIVTGIEIGLKNPQHSPELASQMRDKYKISISEWQSFNKNVFDAMREEKQMIGLIVALVAFVASFNILTTLFVSVTQKQKDISILKALGATNSQVLRIFLKQSILIGIAGASCGLVLALFFSWIIEHVQFIDLPEVYLLATLPVDYDPVVYGFIPLAGIIIAALAGVYPAWAATKVTPTQGIVGSRRQS